MSEQRNSAEIEDVLSSIRRLVSEELRPETRPARAARRSKKAAQPDKLILTPSLRVEVAVAPAPLVLEPLITSEKDRVRDNVVVDMSSHKGRKSPLMAVPSPAPIADPAGAEAVAAVLRDAPVGSAARDVVEDAEIAFEPAQVTAVTMLMAAMDEPIIADEAPFVDADVAEIYAVQHPPEPERQDIADSNPARDAQPEKVVLPSFQSHRVGLAGRTHAEQDMEMIDEAALRDIVRDVIREEFQGMLGDRITRNVRKLVRAEINRALVSKGLS